MGNVSTNVNSIVSSDGTRSRLQRVGSTQDNSALLDNVFSFPDGSQNRSRSHVLKKTREKWLGLQVKVVLSEQFLSGLGELDGHQLESSLLESAKDRSNKSSLDSVGLIRDIETTCWGQLQTPQLCFAEKHRDCTNCTPVVWGTVKNIWPYNYSARSLQPSTNTPQDHYQISIGSTHFDSNKSSLVSHC
jgi:hypothetical protein